MWRRRFRLCKRAQPARTLAPHRVGRVALDLAGENARPTNVSDHGQENRPCPTAGLSHFRRPLRVSWAEDQFLEMFTHRILLAAAMLAVPGFAQEPASLHDGTPVRLRLARNLSSADAKTGETVDLEVVEDVKIADTVVI